MQLTLPPSFFDPQLCGLLPSLTWYVSMKLTGILKSEYLLLTWETFAQFINRSWHFLLTDSVVFLLLRSCPQSLPWQAASKKVHHYVRDRLYIITTTLLCQTHKTFHIHVNNNNFLPVQIKYWKINKINTACLMNAGGCLLTYEPMQWASAQICLNCQHFLILNLKLDGIFTIPRMAEDAS